MVGIEKEKKDEGTEEERWLVLRRKGKMRVQRRKGGWYREGRQNEGTWEERWLYVMGWPGGSGAPWRKE